MTDISQHTETLHTPFQPVAVQSSKRTNAAALLRASASLFLTSWVIVFIISVARRQEPAWPLKNISQYAQHYPAIYFFRAGLVTAAVFLMQAGAALLPRVLWLPSLLWLAAIGAAGAAVVSCAEDNTVHSTFALVLFLAFAVLIARAAAAAQWAASRTQRGPLFRAVPSATTPWLWAASALYIVAGLTFAILVGGLGSGSFQPVISLSREARDVTVSLLEWTITADIMLFLVHFAHFLP